MTSTHQRAVCGAIHVEIQVFILRPLAAIMVLVFMVAASVGMSGNALANEHGGRPSDSTRSFCKWTARCCRLASTCRRAKGARSVWSRRTGGSSREQCRIDYVFAEKRSKADNTPSRLIACLPWVGLWPLNRQQAKRKPVEPLSICYEYPLLIQIFWAALNTGGRRLDLK